MANIVSRLSRFARSPQGRRLADQAVRAAGSPKNRRQMEKLRHRLLGGGRGRRH